MIGTSAQNDFNRNHANLFLEAPYSLKSSKDHSYEKIKRSYAVYIPENRNLYAKQLEYEADVLRQVKENRIFFTTLSSLFERRNDLSAQTLDTCYAILEKQFPQSEITKKLKVYIDNSKKLFIGKDAPNIGALTDETDKIAPQIVYSRNDFTLITFWASWCVPCRKEMSELKKTFPQLNKIQIVSVNLDTDESRWRKAFEEEKIPWLSLHDELGFEGATAKTFNVSIIPANILVDRSGKIVAFGDDLARILEVAK